MDRAELAQVAQSLRSHLEIIEHFLAYPPQDERAMQLEILSRCNSIEAKLAQLRAGVMAKDSGRPDSHVLGDRPVRPTNADLKRGEQLADRFGWP